MVYPISKLWYYPLLKIFLKRAKGMDNIPRYINFIVAANHSKLIDPILIYYPIIKTLNKKLHFIASPRWIPTLGSTICEKWAGCIPAYGGKTYGLARQALMEGKLVGIFPEGYLKNRLKIPKNGVIRLSIETKTPILPVGVKSSYKPWNSSVNIGKPFYATKAKGIEEQLHDLMRELYDLKEDA